MEGITVKEILEATKGTLLCGDIDTQLVHISIDSRTMKGQDLFVPLVGERVDAHRFIAQALECGAAATLTSEHEAMDSKVPFIRVADTKQALQDIGCYYRKRLNIPLVGITGSVGKTTTREMVAAALSAGFKVYKTPANHNSQVGVPITLSEILKEDEIGVIELGMSEPGELTVIAQLAWIQMAVITNVGITHIEQLGSKENIYNEKLSIQDGLSSGGTLFLNGDDELLRDTVARDGFRTIYYGTSEVCDYRAVDIISDYGYPSFLAVHGEERVPVTLKVMGLHNVLNAMVSLAVAKENGISMWKAAKQLGSFTGFQGRQQIYECQGMTLIDDTYNASPVSMKAGLEVLISLDQGRRKVAVLADMKELGAEERKFHYEIGQWISEQPVDMVVTLGELAIEIAKGIHEHTDRILVSSFTEKQELLAYLDTYLNAGDCVLLKGSNSMKLSEVVTHYIKNQ